MLIGLLALVFSLTVKPSVTSAPAKLILVVHVDPNPRARWLTVGIDAENYVRTSVIPMEGDRAPITNRIEWRDVPAGEFDVYAILDDGDQHVLSTTITHIIVTGRD